MKENSYLNIRISYRITQFGAKINSEVKIFYGLYSFFWIFHKNTSFEKEIFIFYLYLYIIVKKDLQF